MIFPVNINLEKKIYCRISDDSGVYVYRNSQGVYTCCSCSLSSETNSEGNINFVSEASLLSHLSLHISAGQKVPENVLRELEEEISNKLGE